MQEWCQGELGAVMLSFSLMRMNTIALLTLIKIRLKVTYLTKGLHLYANSLTAPSGILANTTQQRLEQTAIKTAFNLRINSTCSSQLLAFTLKKS